MALSFLKIFKRKAAPEPSAPVAVVEKPSSERLSKTVMPNASRAASAGDPFHSGVAVPAAAVVVPAPAPRPISLNTPPPTPSAIPPAVALALEPKIERALPFTLADVVGQMPSGLVRPLSDAEGRRRVLLKAAELERGMANGRPTVSIGTIHEQVPEIFTRPVAPSDTTQVALPFAKVLEQFTAVQMRADQYREQAVPQVETPFLKVTLEDDTKFGTTTGPFEIDSLANVRVLPATAEAIAAAEPEPAAKQKPIPAPAMPAPAIAQNGNGSANGNGQSNGDGAGAQPFEREAAAPPSPAPTRIPFKLTPNGTGVTAAERVPASTGGTSVPTSLQTAPPAAAVPPPVPTRIPFKLAAAPKPADDHAADEKPAAKGEPWLTKESFAAGDHTAVVAPPPARAAGKPALKISLPLKPILQGLPPFQLTGDISGVSNDARIELPFAVVEPQLASGRVHLSPEEFAAALPPEHAGLFSAKDIAAPVLLPLQDVLKNLPNTALRMRDDQEEQERGSNFATPFSTTAEEDARRFNVAAAPVPKPAISLTTPDPEPEVKSEAAVIEDSPDVGARPAVVASTDAPTERRAAKTGAQVAPELEPAKAPVLKLAPAHLAVPVKLPPPPKERTPLQKALQTEQPVEPKMVVAYVEKMDGLEGCAIMFGDGLNLAGQLPESYQADGLCAMAPSLMQRIENHMVETKLGPLRGMTLSCSSASITFFMHDNLCLAALHKGGSLAPDVRERLDGIVLELSKTYSQPA